MARFYIGGEDVEVTDSRIIELKYYILKQELFYEDFGKKIITYGIEIEKIEKGIIESNSIKNVTCDNSKINEIGNILKENSVLPVHLKDIILDILS